MTMRSNKAIVNAAGQTITTAGLAAGGALNPEQAKKFIQQTFEATPLSGLVRHELRSAKTGEIDKIGVGRRLLRKKTENTDDGYRSGVKHGKLEYACTPVRLPWEITEETLRENIEGSNYETIVTNLMTRQIGCDREDLCLNGDERYAKVKEFSSSETYAIGDLVAYNKKVYQYTASHAAGAFDAGEATELGTVDDADFLKVNDGWVKQFKETYVDLLKEQSSLEQQIAEAEANLDAERQRRGMRQDDVTGDWVSGSGFWMEDSPWVAWTSDIDDYKKSLEELQAAYDENQQTLSDIEGEWRGVAQAVEDAQNQTVTYDEAVSMATSSAQSALDELTAAYDKAYESARTSIEGQIGLFDTMKTSSELSISDMEKAMQSQTDYLNLYSENLKKAAEYGLDDGLIKSLSDGSEESAGYINAIIQNIEKLGGSTEGMPAAASKFVDEFNSKFEETEKAKDAFADNIAKMETDFDKTMSDIEQTMTGTVEKMEMADEAKEAAQATIKAYCDAIRSMTGEAGSAAEAVANAAASHLKTAPTTTPTATTVTGHANGTLSAQEDVYIAGEKGPELIIGARGSEVFPTQETERILAAVNSAENATNAPEPTASPLPENDLPEGMEAVKEYSYLTADGQGSDAQPTGIEYVEPEVQAQTTEEAAPAEEAPVNTTAPAASDAQQEAPASSSDAPSIGETVKRIILEINGSGSIDVGGMNEESVLDILTRHAKPVLMSIIKGEIFEEGDLAYDF